MLKAQSCAHGSTMEIIEEVANHKSAYQDVTVVNGGINGLHIDEEDDEESGEVKGHDERTKIMMNGHGECVLQQPSMQQYNLDSNPHLVQCECSNGEGDDTDTMPPLHNGDLDPHELCLNLPVTNLIAVEEEELRTSGDKTTEVVTPRHRGGKLVLKDKLPPPKESLLLRLFESKLLDASIAITHLYKSKEPGVQTYIGKFDGKFSTKCRGITSGRFKSQQHQHPLTGPPLIYCLQGPTKERKCCASK